MIPGLTYNFLPFMVLPLYAAWRRRPLLLEAADDLYATPFVGVPQGDLAAEPARCVSGTLLTFIPAAGDYVNAALLGQHEEPMIGNIIHTLFFEVVDYTAAALSVILMAAIMLMVSLYMDTTPGTEELL